MLTFPSAPAPITCGTCHKASAGKRKLTFSFRGRTQLTFHISPPTLPVRDITHIPVHILYLGFLLCHLWMIRPLPRAREHLRSCLHLTNPCAKRKVLRLTKPKGKIYKTKYLGHYITCITFISKTVWFQICIF